MDYIILPLVILKKKKYLLKLYELYTLLQLIYIARGASYNYFQTIIERSLSKEEARCIKYSSASNPYLGDYTLSHYNDKPHPIASRLTLQGYIL